MDSGHSDKLISGRRPMYGGIHDASKGQPQNIHSHWFNLNEASFGHGNALAGFEVQESLHLIRPAEYNEISEGQIELFHYKENAINAATYFISEKQTTLPKLPYFVQLKLFADLFNAVSTLHAYKLIHGDIKPENLWIEDVQIYTDGELVLPKLYLGDYGSVTEFGEDMSKKGLSYRFGAPERYKRWIPYEAKPQSDIISVAKTIWVFLEGIYTDSDGYDYGLFETDRPFEMLDETKSNISKQYGNKLYSKLLRSLDTDPSRRHQSVQEFQEDFIDEFRGIVIEKFFAEKMPNLFTSNGLSFDQIFESAAILSEYERISSEDEKYDEDLQNNILNLKIGLIDYLINPSNYNKDFSDFLNENMMINPKIKIETYAEMYIQKLIELYNLYRVY